MSGFLIGLAVGCGLLIALVRRRRSAIALFALQSLALGMGAIAVSTGYGESSLAAVALVLRGISLPALLALLRKQHKYVAVYTCNTEADIQKALRLGVDMLISDVPDRAIRLRDDPGSV